MTATTHHKALEDILGGLPVLAVALSGGVDSRFLVHMALRAGCRVVALHATGPHVAPRETLWARDWAQRTEVRLMLVEFDPLPIPAVTSGSPDRCYHCKRALMQALRRALPEDAACAPLCDGTNADDLAAHRPGLRALHECGVRSPLAEAGIHKAHIRTLGAATGLAAPEQAARPCLLTRLPYGMRPSAPPATPPVPRRGCARRHGTARLQAARPARRSGTVAAGAKRSGGRIRRYVPTSRRYAPDGYCRTPAPGYRCGSAARCAQRRGIPGCGHRQHGWCQRLFRQDHRRDSGDNVTRSHEKRWP